MSYQERLDKITKMLKETAKENGYFLQMNWIEGATCVGYDANIYICERKQYEAEFGAIEE